MPALKNPRHEAFAQGLAKGMTQDAAYEAAGYKPSRKNASRLKTNEDVAARVAELVEKGAERAIVTVERVLQELARIGFADPRQCFTPGGNLVDVQDWPDDLAHAIASVEVVTKPGDFDEDGKRTVDHVHKIKFWDKNSALEKIAKHLGMFVELHELTGKGGGPVEIIRRIIAAPTDN